jgi:N-acetylglucosaminyldiphosphoundecaprenol N-acetyl-beta-D-mannosaminyltransferase
MPEKVTLLDLPIDNVNLEEAINRIDQLVSGGQGAFVVTPNVDYLVNLRRDQKFRHIVNEAHLVLADGMPLVWASRFLGTPLKERVTGADLFPKLLERAAKHHWKVFLLGGKPGVAQRIARKVRVQFSDLPLVGCCSPPFGFENDVHALEEIAALVGAARPDLLCVGLSSPKQEQLIAYLRQKEKIPLVVGVGAAFDFTAGTVRRAPHWMQKAGLEWAYRLASEPRRLWRRYLRDTKFFWYVLQQKLSGRPGL